MRVARATVPGLVHHVIARFTDRRFLVASDEERSAYLALLGRAMTGSDWSCLAFAIMSSHLHLAMIAGESPAEQWMRRVHPRFASWMNERYEGLGPVFAERCAMWAIEPSHVPTLLHYIHNNPVRAGVVGGPAHSSWTSARAYAELEAAPSWLRIDTAIERTGLEVSQLIGTVDAADLRAPAEVVGIHKAARKRGLIEVATPILGDRVEVPLLIRRRTWLRPSVEMLMAAVEGVTGVEQWGRFARGSDAIQGRAVALHAARAMGISITAIAAATGVTSQACTRQLQRPLSDTQRVQVEAVLRRL